MFEQDAVFSGEMSPLLPLPCKEPAKFGGWQAVSGLHGDTRFTTHGRPMELTRRGPCASLGHRF